MSNVVSNTIITNPDVIIVESVIVSDNASISLTAASATAAAASATAAAASAATLAALSNGQFFIGNASNQTSSANFNSLVDARAVALAIALG
tara:strand:+ start:7574 stop:7849 length:276 start_codon:yes stop_codon:yes gene_type:complete